MSSLLIAIPFHRLDEHINEIIEMEKENLASLTQGEEDEDDEEPIFTYDWQGMANFDPDYTKTAIEYFGKMECLGNAYDMASEYIDYNYATVECQDTYFTAHYVIPAILSIADEDVRMVGGAWLNNKDSLMIDDCGSSKDRLFLKVSLAEG